MWNNTLIDLGTSLPIGHHEVPSIAATAQDCTSTPRRSPMTPSTARTPTSMTTPHPPPTEPAPATAPPTWPGSPLATTAPVPREPLSANTVMTILGSIIVVMLGSFIYATNNDIDRLDTKIDEGFAAVDAKFAAQDTKIYEGFAAVDTKFAAQDTKIDEGFDAVDTKFDAVDARFDAQDAKFDAQIDARFDAVDTRFDAVDARFDAQDAKFDEINLKLTALIAALDSTNAVVADLAGRLTGTATPDPADEPR